MSNSNTESDPTQITYSDFYELLEVDQTADTELIENRGRQLLAAYHPDRSENEDSEEIYKLINRAQVVLTDPSQREIYDRLGHEEYIERREKDGTVSHRGTITSGSFTPATESRETMDSDGSTNATTERNERNTGQADGSREIEGYGTISEIEESSHSRLSIWRIFRQMWAVRLLIGVTAIAAGVYAGKVGGGVVPSVFTDGVTSTVTGNMAVVTGSITTLTIVATGLIAYAVLKQVEDDITLESQLNQRQQQNQEDSRGYNLDTGPTNRQQASSDWDVDTQRNTVGNNSQTLTTERTNSLLKSGTQALILGVLVIGIGSFLIGDNPIQYLYTFSTPGVSEAIAWVQGESGPSLGGVVVNLALGVITLIICIAGGIATAVGLSKEVWYRHYFTKQNHVPFVWDAAVGTLVTTAVIGSAFLGEPVEWMSLSGLPTPIQQAFAAGGQETGLTLFIVSVLGLLLSTVALKIRVGVESQA